MNLSEVLSIDYDDVELNKIDFNKFDSVNNAEPIVSLLKSYSLDIVQIYNAKFEYKINLKPFYLQRAKNFIANYEEKYKDKLFHDYCSMVVVCKRHFISNS